MYIEFLIVDNEVEGKGIRCFYVLLLDFKNRLKSFKVFKYGCFCFCFFEYF